MRTLQGPNGSVASSALLSASAIALTAGMTLVEKDLVSLDDDGLAYKVTDAGPFATVLPNQGVDVIAPTSISGDTATSANTAPAVILPDGTFVVYAQRAGTHLRFQRYSRQGALIKQAEFAYAAPLTGCRFVALANGNMAFSAIANGNMQHMVLDPNLVPVLPLTTIETANATASHHRMIPLAGGGYALSYARATPAQIRFAIYSNTGAAVLAPVTAYTIGSGTPQAQIRLAQFASGNILLVFRFDVAGDFVRTAVYSGTGAVVQAATLYAPMNTLLTFPRAVTIGGNTACLAWAASSTGFAGIVNSSGAVVGTTLSLSPASNLDPPIVGFDGTNFKVLSFFGAPLAIRMTTFSTAGAAASATTVDNGRTPFSSWSGAGVNIEWSYLDGEFLMHWGSTSLGGFSYLTRVKDDASFEEVTQLGNDAGIPPAQLHPPLPLMPGVALVTHGGALAVWSFVVKRWRSAAIQGVALASATRGADVVVAALTGFLPTNEVVCPRPVAFNHNATSVLGQRGTLFPKGVALRGLTA
jgi:hypothetical protein